MTIEVDAATLALIAEAEEVLMVEAREAGALGFMARCLVQATMPHSKPDSNEHTRVNGGFALTMIAPSEVGLPYGSIPRLVMAWITAEAVRTKSRKLVLGETLAEFMRELDYERSGGKRGGITRLRKQLRSLFATSISCTYSERNRDAGKNYNIVSDFDLWWDPQSPEQAGLWESHIVLGEAFFKEITARPVPVDMRVLKALKRSPMALDVYCWLTYRFSYLKKPSPPIPWEGLAMQFGSNYGRIEDFKPAFRRAMRKVLTFYPDAVNAVQLDTKRGLLLKPARTHVLPTEPKR